MKRVLLATFLLLVPILCGAVVLEWDAPTTYVDGSEIDLADRGNIIYHIYSGPTESGPWVSSGSTSPGALSVILPDPEYGQIRWFTASASLYGSEEGPKAAAVSITIPFRRLDAPSGLRIR